MRMSRLHLLPLTISGVMAAATVACTIEPPLHLPDAIDIEINYPEIVTEIDVVWNSDGSWREQWWYGWDEIDDRLFGTLDYPMPSNYEARIYGFGSCPEGAWMLLESHNVRGNTMRRRFPLGYYDFLIWSNIDSEDGTQVLRVVEDDPDNIVATTSLSKVKFPMPSMQLAQLQRSVYNNPEIFYGGWVDDLHVTRDTADYDYFDATRNVWVKHVEADVYPLVYTYLVQVVLYNNRGKVTGTNDRSGVSALANGVSIHTGHTSNSDVIVTYDTRLKTDLPARGARRADILGGKLTTFGLCDMERWRPSRSAQYRGSRGDLPNHVVLDLTFSNRSDSVYAFEVTDQMQRQAHGGVITVEIDVDTLSIPRPESHAGGSFTPIIMPGDTITYEFEM